MYETYIKRTIFTAKCECGGLDDAKTENPPRERQCPSCGKWIPYIEESAIGPDLRKVRV